MMTWRFELGLMGMLVMGAADALNGQFAEIVSDNYAA